MYTYKNKKTGAVISTHGKVTGKNWELVKSDKKGVRKAAKPPKRDEEEQVEADKE